MIILGHKIKGKGKKVLVFLHELMGDHKNYEACFPYFDLEQYTLVFMDLRAYGMSSEIKGLYTCEEAANDVINTLEYLKLKEVHLLAHSMSTIIAQKTALLSKKIKSLILITPISPSGMKMSQASKEALLNEMQNNEKNIENIVRSASKRHNETWVHKRIIMATQASSLEARVAYMKMYLNSDFKEEAKKISLPINIIVGKYDFPIFSFKTVLRTFSDIYKQVNVLECQEAGHYVMLECPVYFASQVEAFLKNTK